MHQRTWPTLTAAFCLLIAASAPLSAGHHWDQHWAGLYAKHPPGLPCFFYPKHLPQCPPGPHKDYAPYAYSCPERAPTLYFGPTGPHIHVDAPVYPGPLTLTSKTGSLNPAASRANAPASAPLPPMPGQRP